MNHPGIDQNVGQENLTPRQDFSTVIKPEKLFDVKPRPLEISPQNSFGLPLLHLQLKPHYIYSSVSRASVTVPSVPIRSVAEERTYPRLSLLHSCLSPGNMVIIFLGAAEAQPYIFHAMSTVCLMKSSYTFLFLIMLLY